MSGNNTLAGVTTVSAGSLKIASGATVTIGNGGTTGSISGNVINDGTLGFNRSDNITFTGATSGTGALAKSGAGILTLIGDHAAGAGTTINAGTLSIGNGGTSGSLSGNIANNSTLLFNRSDDTTFAGAITGDGAVTKLGAGILTLSGNNTLAGVTTISAGSLKIAIGATLTVGNGGTSGISAPSSTRAPSASIAPTISP